VRPNMPALPPELNLFPTDLFTGVLAEGPGSGRLMGSPHPKLRQEQVNAHQPCWARPMLPAGDLALPAGLRLEARVVLRPRPLASLQGQFPCTLSGQRFVVPDDLLQQGVSVLGDAFCGGCVEAEADMLPATGDRSSAGRKGARKDCSARHKV
jgi:hypothetical protein